MLKVFKNLKLCDAQCEEGFFNPSNTNYWPDEWFKCVSISSLPSEKVVPKN